MLDYGDVPQKEGNGTIFLLGAGASKPANLPDIDELTTTFISSLNPDEKEVVEFFQKRIEQHYRFDIEQLLQSITDITEQPSSRIQLFYDAPASELEKHKESFPKIKEGIKKHIRKKCSSFENYDYLSHILAFTDDKRPIDIFTLNYDATLEVMCENNNVVWTDGFDPFWEPSNFDRLTSGVRIWKIHGSLFWFEAPANRYVKVPIRTTELADMQYWNGSKLRDVAIYPTLTKNTESGPFPTIISSFRRRLSEADLCIILGYSFRDDHIKNIITKGMDDNPALWLVVVSPHASRNVSDRLLNLVPSIKDRIVTIDADVQTMLGKNLLYEKIKSLEGTRSQETYAHMRQRQVSSRIDNDWGEVIRGYQKLGFYSRCHKVLYNVYEKFPKSEGGQSLEPITYGLCLRFGVESIIAGDKEYANFWLERFSEGCKFIEWNESNAKGITKTIEGYPNWVNGFSHRYSAQLIARHAKLLLEHGIIADKELVRSLMIIIELSEAIAVQKLDVTYLGRLTTAAYSLLNKANNAQ